MPSFEEEAFARAQQMNKRQPFYGNNQQNQKSIPKQEQPPKKEQKSAVEKPPEQTMQKSPSIMFIAPLSPSLSSL